MPHQPLAIVRYLNRVAVLSALFFAVTPPLALYALQYKQQAGQLETAARANALVVNSYIGLNPGNWQFQPERLTEALQTTLFDNSNTRLIDARGLVVAEIVRHNSSLSQHRSAPIYDFGVQVGEVEVIGDLRPIVEESLKVLVGTVLLSLLIFWALRHFPLQALHKANHLRLQELEKRLVAEKNLYQAQKAMMASQRLEAIGRLSAGIAHEVRNPLMLVQLGTEVLANRALPEQAHVQALEEIREAVARADRIVRSLLDFSRQHPPDLAITDLNDLARKALEFLRHAIKTGNIEVQQHLSTESLPVEADRDQLLQVLLNLMTNAIQAIGSQGMIVVTTRSTVLQPENLIDDVAGGLKTGDLAAMLTIEDNGPGLRTTDPEQLFEPFYTTKPLGEGTGLGLPVVRDIMQLHNGSLSVRNQTHGGVIATVMLKLGGDDAAQDHAG